jgi:hypothetical protein
LIAAMLGWVRFSKSAHARNAAITVPAPVVAQAWRSDRNVRMARLLRRCLLEPMQEDLAFRVGRLLGVSGTADVVDATVMLTASFRGDIVVTDDARDFERLAAVIARPASIVTIQSLHQRR